MRNDKEYTYTITQKSKPSQAALISHSKTILVRASPDTPVERNFLMRLDKAVSLTGLARAEAKKMIAAGRVQVNGQIVRDTGLQVNPSEISIDGVASEVMEEVYIMLNKPAGVITATEDKKLPTVIDLLPKALQRRKIGPIGRLDRDVTGLVLLTTNGQMAHRLISPRWKAEKLYRVHCEGALGAADIEAFAAGLVLSDFTAQPARMEILSADPSGSVADVILTEGKFHQVKRMFSAIEHPLESLTRLRIGCIQLDETLALGEFRFLSDLEINGLLQLCNLDKKE